MPALSFVSTVVLRILEIFRAWPSQALTDGSPITMNREFAHSVVTDLTVSFCSPTNVTSSCAPDSRQWRRLEKDLYLHASQQSAWLYIAFAEEHDLSTNDLVVTDIKISEPRPTVGSKDSWESRPGGIWVSKSRYSKGSQQAVTGIDVLFGADAVDPRPQWTLIQPQLQLHCPTEVPVAKLSVRFGEAKPKRDPRITLRARDDGKFKIVQMSDTHMVTGAGVCKDAVDARGNFLPESEADPLTVDFVGTVLDAEKPDFVVLTGDQLHHDILDSQSALFKVFAPLIKRSIPYAAVFGNHDSEGAHALSRKWISP